MILKLYGFETFVISIGGGGNCFGDHIASLGCVFIWEDNYHELFPRVQFTCVRGIETADGVLAIKISGNE